MQWRFASRVVDTILRELICGKALRRSGTRWVTTLDIKLYTIGDIAILRRVTTAGVIARRTRMFSLAPKRVLEDLK